MFTDEMIWNMAGLDEPTVHYYYYYCYYYYYYYYNYYYYIYYYYYYINKFLKQLYLLNPKIILKYFFSQLINNNVLA